MEKIVEKATENLLDKLYTPRQIDERRILSLVMQWKERERGRLKFYQIGRKILYSEKHIFDYLALCESESQNKAKLRKAR